MKTSKYNVYLNQSNCFYIFNQLSSALSQVDEELFLALKNNCLGEITEQKCINELYESNFICEDELIEENVVLAINRTFRYSKDTARITVLPTLNCNFKCWYCYETHTDSMMSNDEMNAAILFCESILSKNRLKIFHLDWFGGEPLLYFDEIIYPFALKIKRMCDEYKIVFKHTITTNGYLISDEMIEKMKDIKLNIFQITLDGAEFYHNKTRFSVNDKESYQTIVRNIISLCKKIEHADIKVRINYTPKNINTIDSIAYSFPEEIRKFIFIEPQMVWQYKDKINSITDLIKEKLNVFAQMGYGTRGNSVPTMSCGCYAENSLQFVINYDLSVYKCTARDFSSQKHSIGKISEEGEFIPNPNYYNYFISSFMENEQCLACEYLPSCNGMCIQKKIEKSIPKCPKKEIQRSLLNQLSILINHQS